MKSVKNLVLAAAVCTLLGTACSVPSPTSSATAAPSAAGTKAGTATGSAGVGSQTAPGSNTPWVDPNAVPGAATWNANSGAQIEFADTSPFYSDGVGSFRTYCFYSHMAADDPLVAPGRPGGSHLHTFFGNTGVDAFSTADSIQFSGDSTCRGGTANRSAYWVPSIVDTNTGEAIVPEFLIAYYKTGYTGVQASEVNTMPQGLRMIAGDSKASGPSGLPHWLRPVSWTCAYDSAGNGTSATNEMQQCSGGEMVKMVVAFPQCWDGRNLDSADHKSHMAYSDNGCPATHPVALPQVSFNVYWNVPDGGNWSWRLSSDTYDGTAGYSGHGDWWNGWDPAVMQTWIDNCSHPGLDCSVDLLGNGMKLV
jgi:Domain of unknown function (DUF1996)